MVLSLLYICIFIKCSNIKIILILFSDLICWLYMYIPIYRCAEAQEALLLTNQNALGYLVIRHSWAVYNVESPYSVTMLNKISWRTIRLKCHSLHLACRCFTLSPWGYNCLWKFVKAAILNWNHNQIEKRLFGTKT